MSACLWLGVDACESYSKVHKCSVNEAFLCNFLCVYHHCGLWSKQSIRLWNADFPLLFKQLRKRIALTINERFFLHTSLPFSAVTGQNSPHIILNIRIAVNDSVKPRTQQYMLCSHALLAWNQVTNLKNIALLADSGQSLLDVLWQSFLCSSRSFGVSNVANFFLKWTIL